MKWLVVMMLVIGIALMAVADDVASIGAPRGERPALSVAPSAKPKTGSLIVTSTEEVLIERGPDGQFHISADVNGQPTQFLVDTGADGVALTVDTARALGIYVDPTGFEVVAMGAGGPVKGQRVELLHLSVAGRTIERVQASVLEGLPTNLLGQSVLRQMGSVELKGDEMRLR